MGRSALIAWAAWTTGCRGGTDGERIIAPGIRPYGGDVGSAQFREWLAGGLEVQPGSEQRRFDRRSTARPHRAAAAADRGGRTDSGRGGERRARHRDGRGAEPRRGGD